MEKAGHSVVPVEAAVAQECVRLLPSSHGLRWLDMSPRVHNCTRFICEMLRQLETLQTSTANITAALSDSVHMLVEVACQSPDDVCTPDSVQGGA